jgi:hypothetical protein
MILFLKVNIYQHYKITLWVLFNKHLRQVALTSQTAWYLLHAGLMHGVRIIPEDGGDNFLRNVS